jgi:hypothetical protein
MQRLAVLAAVAAAIAVPIAANAASASTAGKGQRSITVNEDLRHGTTVFNRPGVTSHSFPKVIHAGDYIVEKAPLLNRAGKRVGTVEGVLTFITPSKNFTSDLFNHRVWILPHGTLFLEGLNSPHLGNHDIVTGGTGAYAGAHGVVTSKGQFDTAHLLP